MFNRVIVPDFTPRQPHVVHKAPAPAPPAPIVPVASPPPPVLKPVYTTYIGQYSQPVTVVSPPPVTLNTPQAAPLLNVGNVAAYTAPYTTISSTYSSGYSPNLETFTSGNKPYFKLASAPSEAADWWQYPAGGPVDMSGNDLNMNSGSINAATTIGATDITATRQMGCSSIGANFVSTDALSSVQGYISSFQASFIGSDIIVGDTIAAQEIYAPLILANNVSTNKLSTATAFISSLNANYISSQVGTISSLSTSIITLDGATLTTAGGTELLLNGIPIATTANLSSLADWALDPAISTINANGNNIISVNDLQVSSITVSTINGTTYPPPATGVTSLNAQTGVVALISAGSTVTITNPSPGTINLETAAGSGFVTSVNGAPGAITVTSDFSTISTSVVGGVTTFSAPTLGVSTDIATTCFGVANSASLSATSAGITANAAAVAAAAAQASADAAAITAGTALASATTALAQSGVTFVNGGTFSTTIAAGTGIGVLTTYASGVQNPTITISATGAGGTPFSYNIYVSNVSGSDATGTGVISNPYKTISAAMTAANAIADSNQVIITLAAGTYTENVSMTRDNIYIVGGSTSLSTATIINGTVTVDMTGTSQLVVVGGLSSVQFTNIVYTNSVAKSQSFVLTDCLIVPGVGVNAISATDTSVGGNGDMTIQNSLIYMSDSVAVICSNCSLNFINTQITNNPALISAATMITTTGTGRISLFGCSVIQASTSSAVQPLINLGNTVGTQTITVSNSILQYTSATADTGTLAKCCIRMANSAPITSVAVYNSLLISEGARTTNGIPTQYVAIQRTGAGTVTLNYGQNLCGATANHLPAAAVGLTKTPYIVLGN